MQVSMKIQFFISIGSQEQKLCHLKQKMELITQPKKSTKIWNNESKNLFLIDYIFI